MQEAYGRYIIKKSEFLIQIKYPETTAAIVSAEDMLQFTIQDR